MTIARRLGLSAALAVGFCAAPVLGVHGDNSGRFSEALRLQLQFDSAAVANTDCYTQLSVWDSEVGGTRVAGPVLAVVHVGGNRTAIVEVPLDSLHYSAADEDWIETATHCPILEGVDQIQVNRFRINGRTTRIYP